jgi:hypothetical protein
MNTASPLFVISVFSLGACCGALLAEIQRRARMDRIKTAFATELRQLCEQSYLQYSHADAGPLRITEEHMYAGTTEDVGEDHACKPQWTARPALHAPEDRSTRVNI